jgi:hypothetical protein
MSMIPVRDTPKTHLVSRRCLGSLSCATRLKFNQRLARADGLRAQPDSALGGAVNLVRSGLDDSAWR